MKSWCLSTPPSKQLWTSMMEFFLSGKTATAASSERTLLIFSSWWRRRKSGPWNGSGKNFVCQTFLSLKEKREMSTCNMGGFGGKLCHKCPLSNYDNLTLWQNGDWWMKKTDEETRQEDCTYLLSSDGLVNRIWLFGSWNFPFFPQFGDIFWQFFKMEHNGGAMKFWKIVKLKLFKKKLKKNEHVMLDVVFFFTK